jgi:leucyl aminopeptidase
MDIIFGNGPADLWEGDALVVFGYEGAPPAGPADARAGELFGSGEFTGKASEISILHGPSGAKAKRLVYAGMGPQDKATTSAARNLTGTVLRTLKGKGLHTLSIDLGPSPADDLVAAVVEGAMLGNFEVNRYHTDPKKVEKYIDSCTVFGGSQAALDRGRILGEAQNYARMLANEPGNLLTPTKLAEHAKEVAAACGLEIDVLDEARMRELGMGSLLGVSIGSAEPPALIVMKYQPASAPSSGDHLGLVGKGVTFDTGGISIKPSEGMEKMKYDMAGGAAVIGAMQAISKLKPSLPVTALIPTVENMPGSRAQRPGDIVTSMDGKTIEVLNTDAEGRLILVDAITYAKSLGCNYLVDAATLTGAIVIALGTLRSGAFTNNQPFLDKFLACSQAEGERMWQLPLDDEYKELLKSAFADLGNIGGRAGGSITAAYFLKEFVGDTPWVHLDIAGTAWLDEAKPYMAKGPTGICVRSFVHLATNW